jgi:hypothetical protein
MLLRCQIGGQFDLKAANDEKIQTNGANGVSRGRMRNHHRRLCRNRTRASGRFYSPGERHSSSCARRGAAAEHAINAAISNLQSIESKYCTSIERNTRLPGNAGYKSRRALSGAPGRPVLARRYFLRSSSGSLAKLTASRRASSLVSRMAAERRANRSSPTDRSARCAAFRRHRPG